MAAWHGVAGEAGTDEEDGGLQLGRPRVKIKITIVRVKIKVGLDELDGLWKVRRDESRWYEMRCGEMRWDDTYDMRCGEIRWYDMRWYAVKWDETSRDEIIWDAVRCGEMEYTVFAKPIWHCLCEKQDWHRAGCVCVGGCFLLLLLSNTEGIVAIVEDTSQSKKTLL